LRIRNEKIYVEVDRTEAGIAVELMEYNVPDEDIIVVYQQSEIDQSRAA
jgi:XisI protein